jgi:hypothetical protein
LGAFVVALAAFGLSAGWTVTIFLLTMIAHVLVQFRGAYALGWPGAVWRTALLLVFSQVALFVFILILAGPGGWI